MSRFHPDVISGEVTRDPVLGYHYAADFWRGGRSDYFGNELEPEHNEGCLPPSIEIPELDNDLSVVIDVVVEDQVLTYGDQLNDPAVAAEHAFRVVEALVDGTSVTPEEVISLYFHKLSMRMPGIAYKKFMRQIEDYLRQQAESVDPLLADSPLVGTQRADSPLYL